jgi:DNA-binding LacI/PurR family transcriptional regulator
MAPLESEPAKDGNVTGTPTLNDIAAVAGVSISSVSKVLNNRSGVGLANRDRILQVAETLGYPKLPARMAAESALEGVCILTREKYATNDQFYGQVLEGVVEECRAQNVPVDVALLMSAETGPQSTAGLFVKTPPKALVMLGVDREEVLDLALAQNCPAVIVNGMDRTMRISSVSPDYYFGGFMATRHLLELGHREIIHVTHPYRPSIVRRLEGFRMALAEAGIPFDPRRHVIDLGSPERLTLEAGLVLHEHLSRDGLRATAFFCVSDIVALGVIQALHAHGYSVPGDVSVIGFDDLPISSHSQPPLTTMHIERRELGRTAVRLLAERAASPAKTVHRIATGVALLPRASTAPLRAR